MTLLAVGNGLMMAFVPVRLSEAGLPTWVAGITVAAMGAGGFVACLVTGRVVRRVNHARAFSAMVAGVILSVLMIVPIDVAPWKDVRRDAIHVPSSCSRSVRHSSA